MPLNKYPATIVPMTASWSTALPDRYVRIGISRGPPRGQRGYRMYKRLAPGPWFRSVEPEEFRRRYLAQLERLDPHQVLSELAELADDKIPALLCFERPPPDPAWCHRGLVASWLFDKVGLEVREIGHEHRGGGWSHPKLPRDWRGSR
jgi:hypothetical protein